MEWTKLFRSRGKGNADISGSYNFRCLSDTVTTSGVVGAERLSRLAEDGYSALINLLPDDSQHAVPDEKGLVTGQGLRYVYIPVDWDAPARDDFDAFCAAMDTLDGGKVHIHCAANFRVSAFYGLYAAGRGTWSWQEAEANIRSLWNPEEFPAWKSLIDSVRAET